MYSLLSILALVSATATLANTHAILVQPAARAGSNGADNLGIKIASPEDAQFFNTCGNAALQPGAPQATVAQGRQLELRWDITIDHVSDPGVTVGLRCAGERDFVKLASGVRAQDLQAQVTIPRAAKVGNCELQWLWTSLEDGGSYIACSDIAVTAADGGNAEPAPPAAPETDDLRKNKQNKERGGNHNGGNRGGNHNGGNRGGYNQNRGGNHNNNQNRGGNHDNQNRGGNYNQNRGGNHNNNNRGGNGNGKNKHNNRPQPQPTRPAQTTPCTSSVVRTQAPPSPTPTRPCTSTQAPRATTTPCTTSQVARATTPCTSSAAQRTAVPTQAADYIGANGQSVPEVPAPAPAVPGESPSAPNPIDQPLYSADAAAPAPAIPATGGEQPPAPVPAAAGAVNEQSSSAAEQIKIAGDDKQASSAMKVGGAGFVTLASVLVAAVFA